jgi:hypothetical protein
MSHRMTVVAAAALGAALLVGAARPAACTYSPDADRNAGLVAGEPRTGMLYLASRGRFFGYRCPDGTAGVTYVPFAS